MRTVFPLAFIFLLLNLQQARADIIFSEDFSSLTGTVASPPPVGDRTERSTGRFLETISVSGWTLNGAVFGFEYGTGFANKSIQLNEEGSPISSISRTISGFQAGGLYELRFEYWGDNVAVGSYGLQVDVGSNTTTFLNSSTGLNTGNFNIGTYSFIADSSNQLLRFTEVNSVTFQSPVFGSITISAVPEPSSTLLVSVSLLGLQFFRRNRRFQQPVVQ